MSTFQVEPAWRKLFELLNDLLLQADSSAVLTTLIDEIDSLVPADRGVVIAELLDGLPFSRRWPLYSEPLVPRFNDYFNRRVPIEYDWTLHRLGPVDWEVFADSEYDIDFNCPLGIGHTFGVGFPNRTRDREIVFVLHRSRGDSGFNERDVSAMSMLQRPLERIYELHDTAQELLRTLPKDAELAYGCRLLSPREAEVADLLCLRLTMREIAAILGLSPRTVERHALHIYQKLKLSSRRALRHLLMPGGSADPAGPV
jgi:DNA-binding CsgD family transcriptional regulator